MKAPHYDPLKISHPNKRKIQVGSNCGQQQKMNFNDADSILMDTIPVFDNKQSDNHEHSTFPDELLSKSSNDDEMKPILDSPSQFSEETFNDLILVGFKDNNGQVTECGNIIDDSQSNNMELENALDENMQSNHFQSRMVQSRKIQSKSKSDKYDAHKFEFFNFQSVQHAYREILSLETRFYQIKFPPMESLANAKKYLIPNNEQSIKDFVAHLERSFLQLNELTNADNAMLFKIAYLIHQVYLISLETPLMKLQGTNGKKFSRRAELKKPGNKSKIISQIREKYLNFVPIHNRSLPNHFSNGIIGNVFMSLFLCHFHAKHMGEDWRKIPMCPTCGFLPTSKCSSRGDIPATTLLKHTSKCPSLCLPPPPVEISES